MNVFEQAKRPLASVLSSPIAMVLMISMLLWATGAPLLMKKADAAQLTNVSDTLTDSDLGVATKHVIRFTTATSTLAGQSIRITFDPATSLFTEAFSAATTTDFTATGMTIVGTVAGCSGAANEVYPVGNYNNGTNEYVDFTVCSGDTLSSGSKQINIGTSTALITNPSTAGSYRILIGGNGGNWDDSGETRVAIIDDVVVTASVDTTFTFTIAGLATSSPVNGDTTTGSTTATVINFGTLTPGAAKVMGQRLNVTTNAANGFSVTVVEDHALLSATGADIGLFKDGASSTPTAWTSPLNTLGSQWTYGHIGITSDDATLSAGDYFGTAQYAGNFDVPLQVFYHNGPTDGIATNIGSTTVAYKIEIGSLQEAGNDYTNSLTYVATPTF